MVGSLEAAGLLGGGWMCRCFDEEAVWYPASCSRVRDEKGKRESHLLSSAIARWFPRLDLPVLNNCGRRSVCCLGNSGQVSRELAMAVFVERYLFGLQNGSRVTFTSLGST